MARRDYDDDDDDYDDDDDDDDDEDDRPRRKKPKKRKRGGGGGGFVDILLFRQNIGAPLATILFPVGVIATSYYGITGMIEMFNVFSHLPTTAKILWPLYYLAILLVGPVVIRLLLEAAVSACRTADKD